MPFRSCKTTGFALCCSFALVATVLLGGCASGGSVRSEESTRWREDMGRVPVGTLEQGIEKIFRKYSLVENRREAGGRDVYYESAWVPRDGLPAEALLGVSNARNRIVIRGRQLESSLSGNAVFRITWELQNEVTSAGASGWRPGPIPNEVVDQFRRVYSDLMLEIRTGVRGE